MRDFGRWLAARRVEAGLDQDELAKALGYKSRGSISNWEITGKVPEKVWPALAKALSVPLEHFRHAATSKTVETPHAPAATTSEPPDPAAGLAAWARAVTSRLEALEQALEDLRRANRGEKPAPVHPVRLAVVSEPSPSDEQPHSGQLVRLRLLGAVAAGLSWEPERQPDEALVPRVYTERCRSECALVQVRGDSMEPTYHDGEHLVIERAMPGRYHKGDVVIARIGGGDITLARYGGQASAAKPPMGQGCVRLLKDNPSHEALELGPGQWEVQAVVRVAVPDEDVERIV